MLQVLLAHPRSWFSVIKIALYLDIDERRLCCISLIRLRWVIRVPIRVRDLLFLKNRYRRVIFDHQNRDNVPTLLFFEHFFDGLDGVLWYPTLIIISLL